MVDVKICGLRDGDTVRFADRAGAKWLGLNFIATSPRSVTTAAAASLLLQVRQAAPVALVADFDDDAVDEVAALGVPILQLHGVETPERVAEIKMRTGLEIWKAVGVSTRADLDALSDYSHADTLLIEAKPPEGSAYRGGHGASFNWSILQDWQAPKPWILAGGLTPDNVGRAIRETGANAVDVSSGVEAVLGVKSPNLIWAFIEAARASQ